MVSSALRVLLALWAARARWHGKLTVPARGPLAILRLEWCNALSRNIARRIGRVFLHGLLSRGLAQRAGVPAGALRPPFLYPLSVHPLKHTENYFSRRMNSNFHITATLLWSAKIIVWGRKSATEISANCASEKICRWTQERLEMHEQKGN